MPDPVVEIISRVSSLQRRLAGLERRDAAHVVCDHFMRLPGLRGFWPMSAFDSTGAAQDQSGHGHHLTYNGNPTYSYAGLAPYIDLDGVGDYLSRADEADLDILGTETYVAAGVRGLTVGGWFYVDDDTAAQGLISKYGAAGQRSWLLYVDGVAAGDPVRFIISDNGTNTDTTTSTNGIVASTWHFCVGRYCDALVGAELQVWIDNTATSAATARNSIFNSNAGFNIGAWNGGSVLNGRASLCFLCAAALSDTIIQSLYQATRALFGV